MIEKRRISIFCRLLGHLHLRTQGRGDRAIGPYDYIKCVESFEKIGCSIGSAWVESGAAFDE